MFRLIHFGFIIVVKRYPHNSQGNLLINLFILAVLGLHYSAGFSSGSRRNCSATFGILTRILSLGQGDLLEKEVATHSRILAWRSPQTEEPGKLQSMGSQRVRHD